MTLILRDRFTQARRSGRAMAGRGRVTCQAPARPACLCHNPTGIPNDRCLEGCLSFEGSAVTGGSGDGRWWWLPERWLLVMAVFMNITMGNANGMSWVWLTAGNERQMAVIDTWYRVPWRSTIEIAVLVEQVVMPSVCQQCWQTDSIVKQLPMLVRQQRSCTDGYLNNRAARDRGGTPTETTDGKHRHKSLSGMAPADKSDRNHLEFRPRMGFGAF